MEFVIDFSRTFFLGVFYAAPVLLGLALSIALIGLIIGRREGWDRADSLYYAFITATTVGYGDFRPSSHFGKFAAVVIAFIGLVMTGIIVAIGVRAVTVAFADIIQSI